MRSDIATIPTNTLRCKCAFSFAKLYSRMALSIESSWAREAGTSLRTRLATRPGITRDALRPTIPARPLGSRIALQAFLSDRAGIAIVTRGAVCTVLSVGTCGPKSSRPRYKQLSLGAGQIQEGA